MNLTVVLNHRCTHEVIVYIYSSRHRRNFNRFYLNARTCVDLLDIIGGSFVGVSFEKKKCS